MNETFHTFFLLIFFNLSLSPRCGIIFLNSSGVFINSWRVVRSLISKSIGKASNIRNKRQKHGYILRLEMLDFFKTYYPANSIEPKPDPFSTCFFIKIIHIRGGCIQYPWVFYAGSRERHAVHTLRTRCGCAQRNVVLYCFSSILIRNSKPAY